MFTFCPISLQFICFWSIGKKVESFEWFSLRRMVHFLLICQPQGTSNDIRIEGSNTSPLELLSLDGFLHACDDLQKSLSLLFMQAERNSFHQFVEAPKYTHIPMREYGRDVGVTSCCVCCWFSITISLSFTTFTGTVFCVAFLVVQGFSSHHWKYSHAASHKSSGVAKSLSLPCLLLNIQNLFPFGAAIITIFQNW